MNNLPLFRLIWKFSADSQNRDPSVDWVSHQWGRVRSAPKLTRLTATHAPRCVSAVRFRGAFPRTLRGSEVEVLYRWYCARFSRLEGEYR
eukprot:COSAG02_NODE_2387_length_8986_cov_12.395184_11_plen_90_part_00